MRQMERGTITEAHYLLYEQTYEKKIRRHFQCRIQAEADHGFPDTPVPCLYR